jgi:hypothetical protein
MSYAQRHTVALTTAADGSATGYTPVVTGKISAIHYLKTDFDNGVDFTVTSEATGQGIWAELDVNASAVRAPRQATHSTAGVASLYAAAGTAVQDKIAVAEDRIKIVIAQGGDTKSGTVIVVLE